MGGRQAGGTARPACSVGFHRLPANSSYTRRVIALRDRHRNRRWYDRRPPARGRRARSRESRGRFVKPRTVVTCVTRTSDVAGGGVAVSSTYWLYELARCAKCHIQKRIETKASYENPTVSLRNANRLRHSYGGRRRTFTTGGERDTLPEN
ncbi:hypothetical protein EVAR_85364_1 [Eumeta japonica]|uniref:Uncharacterized protein n=1 Tax=Eumeta variegata TaxID=151549 RepID=A0A4C1WS20_EUMVA|nr:hypothetical protein EVAR_85364_1 [Eumeta japonica]